MAAIVAQYDLTAMQDALRPARNFINTLAGLVNEQSYAGTDGYAVNPPMQYQIVGNTGNAIEGTPYYQNLPAPVTFSNNFMVGMLALAAAFFVLKK